MVSSNALDFNVFRTFQNYDIFFSQTLADPEVLRCLTSSVSSALDEAAAALTRMRAGPY